MTVWQSRGALYKAGFLATVIGAALFAVGFCTPSWVSFKGALPQTTSMGLWQTCTDDLSLCVASVDSDNPGWLKATRALECISMFFAVSACIVGLYSNCILKARLTTDFFNKNMETSAVVSVVFGVFGLIIYATQIKSFQRSMLSTLSWGFVLVCVSHTLLGAGALLMLVPHKFRLIALQDHFAHRQMQDSFHTQVDFPDYISEGGNRNANIAPLDVEVTMTPPAYETVVNSPHEGNPPPYSEVDKSHDPY